MLRQSTHAVVDLVLLGQPDVGNAQASADCPPLWWQYYKDCNGGIAAISSPGPHQIDAHLEQVALVVTLVLRLNGDTAGGDRVAILQKLHGALPNSCLERG
jgi:hypothetical protein